MNVVEYNPVLSLPSVLLPGVIELTPLATEARFNLRVRLSSLPEVSKALGCELPSRMGDMATNGGRRAISVGPDEWLLSASIDAGDDIKRAIGDLANRLPVSLVDVTDRECALRIDGPQSAYVLKAACPIDVSAMSVNTATRTLFDQADVLIVRESETTYRLQVLRSWSVHVASLLAVISREVATGL